MKVEFSKYHGLGNDFLLLDDADGGLSNWLTGERIRALCDRHTGVGADGILVRRDSEQADQRMLLFNSDGTPAEISGNGLRCFVLFLRDAGYGVSREIAIETGGGVQRARLVEPNVVESTMPVPKFAGGRPKLVDIEAQGMMFKVCVVNVGNPHGVVFGPVRDITFARTYGPALEKHSAFPGGANIEFVHVVSKRECRLVVWERGAGITMACGSGSVATAAAGAALGDFAFDTSISVRQPGGALEITVASGFREIRQKGEAEFVFRGEIEL
ncbi:diaminopimelate epimerase [bacterium]|nr:diaminopimelate epimerase [bacterium]MBU1984095.1 diaminopimelate epimerase [bacterium]